MPAAEPEPALLASAPRVLSVQAAILGHRTYAQCLRDYFQSAIGCQVDSVWQNEEREWGARLLVRGLTRTLPGGWIGARNADVRRVRTELGDAYLARRLAVRHLARTSYQCLHFHTQVGALLSTDLMRRVPTVITGDMTSAQGARAFPHAAWRWTHAPSIALDRAAFRAAAQVAPWSEWAARSVVADYGVDPRRVQAINPGVDLAAFAWAAGTRRAAGLANLLFVGNDFARKGGEDVLDIFLHGLSEQAELHLVTGAEIGISHPRVHVHRGVSAYSPEWRALYQAADVFVLPTHFEAFGLVFMEAMAAGLPVVGSRINAIPEMVAHGQTGLLVMPGDRHALAQSVQSLVSDAALRRRMGAAGRARAVQAFDAQANFGRLEALFLSAAASKESA